MRAGWGAVLTLALLGAVPGLVRAQGDGWGSGYLAPPGRGYLMPPAGSYDPAPQRPMPGYGRGYGYPPYGHVQPRSNAAPRRPEARPNRPAPRGVPSLPPLR